MAFAREVLACEPWSVQEAIMRSVAANKRTTVRSCHNSGKTWVAGCLTHWFLRSFQPSLVITTAPTERQVKDVLWKEIRARSLECKLPGTLNLMSLELSPSQRAMGLSTNDPIRFQGWHEQNILFLVDEASGIDEAIYQAIEGCLTGPNAKLLLIGNPNNAQGTFYDSFTSNLYHPFHIEASDVPTDLLPPGWQAERLIEWGEDSPFYQVRVLGNFPDQGDDALISLKWVTDAQNSELEPQGDEVIIGCDVARFGLDESVAYARRGKVVIDAEYWRGMDTTVTVRKVAEMARRCRATRIQVDDVGVGGGPTDFLAAEFRDTGIAVLGINVGRSAVDDEKYKDLRSEIFAGLADRFQSGDIRIPADDKALAAQLVVLRKKYTPRGQMQLESKDDLKKRRPAGANWRSPDRADALALAFCCGGNRFMPVSSVGRGRPM